MARPEKRTPGERYVAPTEEKVRAELKIVGTLVHHGKAIEDLYDVTTTFGDKLAHVEKYVLATQKDTIALSTLLRGLDESIAVLREGSDTEEITNAISAAILPKIAEDHVINAANSALLATTVPTIESLKKLPATIRDLTIDVTPIENAVTHTQDVILEALRDIKAVQTRTAQDIVTRVKQSLTGDPRVDDLKARMEVVVASAEQDRVLLREVSDDLTRVSADVKYLKELLEQVVKLVSPVDEMDVAAGVELTPPSPSEEKAPTEEPPPSASRARVGRRKAPPQ